jgi:hypothetical protein
LGIQYVVAAQPGQYIKTDPPIRPEPFATDSGCQTSYP